MARDDDWAAPGAVDLGSGVHRIPLPMPSEGLRATNVYAVFFDDGLVLVDAGWASPAAEAELQRMLGTLGAGLGDIRRFLITHAHRDHYSLAVAIRDRFGTPASIGREEQANLDLLATTTSAERATGLGTRLARAGAATLAARIGSASRYLDSDLLVYGEDPDQWLDDGDALPGGLRAVATPGHTRGHTAYLAPDRGMFFTGDHVLPRITPSVGNEPARPEWPLRDYLESLARVRALPDARMLPAHGAVGESVHARVDELLAHHVERLGDSLSAIEAGATTAFEAAQALRWTRHQRALDELELLEQRMAVMETAAHLDVLALRDELVREDSGGVVRYRIGAGHD